MDFNKEILRSKLLKVTTRFRNPKNIREYYWKCITSGGYSIESKNEVINRINQNDSIAEKIDLLEAK